MNRETATSTKHSPIADLVRLPGNSLIPVDTALTAGQSMAERVTLTYGQHED